jgi:hypothetical protein
MATQPRLRRLLVPETLSLRDFSGGPNLRDAQPELAPNEQPDAFNVTYDERGGVSARLGYQKVNSSPYGGGLVSNVWYSTTVSNYVTQAGASVYVGTNTTARKTFTTSARAGFADFAGKLIAQHPVDGLFTTPDGITWTAVADADAPKGDSLYVWQNKLFSNVAAQPRVQWSAAGDPTAWDAADYVDIREKDDEPVVALAGASGIDVALGKAGLVLLKRRSAYRMYDSASGAYVTVDQRVGAASAIAWTVWRGRVYTIGEYGIHWTDGLSPFTNVSQRLEPLWSPDQVALDHLGLWCAGVRHNRLHFSLPRSGSAANDLALEHHPEQGWITAGSCAASAYANYALQTDKLYAGSPTVSGHVYEMFVGGTDDGAPIQSRFQTRWFELAQGNQFSLWRVTFRGKGAPHVAFRYDYRDTDGPVYDLSLSDAGNPLLYDTGLLYDAGLLYTQPTSDADQSVYPPGTARAVSIRVTALTSETSSLPQLLGAGQNPQTGGWRMQGIDFDYTDMTYA